jgi:hypothetical protein
MIKLERFCKSKEIVTRIKGWGYSSKHEALGSILSTTKRERERETEPTE